MKTILTTLLAFAAVSSIQAEASSFKSYDTSTIEFLSPDTYTVDTDGTVKGL